MVREASGICFKRNDTHTSKCNCCVRGTRSTAKNSTYHSASKSEYRMPVAPWKFGMFAFATNTSHPVLRNCTTNRRLDNDLASESREWCLSKDVSIRIRTFNTEFTNTTCGSKNHGNKRLEGRGARRNF